MPVVPVPTEALNEGVKMHAWARELWPICRSLTGEGVRQTLQFLKEQVPQMQLFEVPSGSQAFDWTVPSEWNIRDAYVLNPQGERVIDFKKSNLHVVGYSVPIDQTMSRDELESHLHSLPDRPEVIPYVVSYYQRNWGFCLSHTARENLGSGPFRVVIDSDLEAGSLTYGEVIIPGETEEEIFLSTYVCHPSMANNELSGPVVQTAILQWYASLPYRRYTMRAVFIPETIGAIVYLSRNLEILKKRVKAGFNLSCIGDDRSYSMVASRKGNTLADRAAKLALRALTEKPAFHSFLDRGSDERQYCAPGIELPLVTLCRSKFNTFPEYHTSADDLETVVTATGLAGGFRFVQSAIEHVLANNTYLLRTLGEPQLGKRGLYHQIQKPGVSANIRGLMNLIMHMDGTMDLLEICDHIGENLTDMLPLLEAVLAHHLVEKVERDSC